MKSTIKKSVFVAVLAALSTVIFMFTEIALPFFPTFLKLDISTLPALLGGFAFGPVAGAAIVLIKDILHLLITPNFGSPVGELADAIVSLTLVLTASVIYMIRRTKNSAWIGAGVGFIFMIGAAVICNRYIFIPLYLADYSASQISNYLLAAVLPFNAIKGFILISLTLILYKRMSGFIHRLI